MNKKELANLIDHTNLKLDCTREDIFRLCDEAKNYEFRTVCVYPKFVDFAKKTLDGFYPKVCTVIGFPSGDHSTGKKLCESLNALNDGVDELDIVMNYKKMIAGHPNYTRRELKDLVEAVKKSHDVIVKVILENCYLNEEQIRMACEFVVESGADFVKTSTGFGNYGAKAEHIKLMRGWVGPDFGVKAAGGVRTLEQALEMVEAGANRLGCSSSVKIMEGFK